MAKQKKQANVGAAKEGAKKAKASARGKSAGKGHGPAKEPGGETADSQQSSNEMSSALETSKDLRGKPSPITKRKPGTRDAADVEAPPSAAKQRSGSKQVAAQTSKATATKSASKVGSKHRNTKVQDGVDASSDEAHASESSVVARRGSETKPAGAKARGNKSKAAPGELDKTGDAAAESLSEKDVPVVATKETTAARPSKRGASETTAEQAASEPANDELIAASLNKSTKRSKGSPALKATPKPREQKRIEADAAESRDAGAGETASEPFSFTNSPFASEPITVVAEPDVADVPSKSRRKRAGSSVADAPGVEATETPVASAQTAVSEDPQSQGAEDEWEETVDEGAAVAAVLGTPEPEPEEDDGLSEEEKQHIFLKGLIEALLFSSDKPMTMRDLARGARLDRKRTTELLKEVTRDCRRRGMNVVEIAGGFGFRSNPAYGSYIQKLLSLRPVRLSRAQLETLAVIAYRQPVTRPEIDEVRGVDSGPVIKGLLDRDLIKMLGKKDEVGRPMLYGTTEAFLELFSLEALKDLPNLKEFTELSDDSRVRFQEELGEEAPRPVEISENVILEDASVAELTVELDGESAEVELAVVAAEVELAVEAAEADVEVEAADAMSLDSSEGVDSGSLLAEYEAEPPLPEATLGSVSDETGETAVLTESREEEE